MIKNMKNKVKDEGWGKTLVDLKDIFWNEYDEHRDCQFNIGCILTSVTLDKELKSFIRQLLLEQLEWFKSEVVSDSTILFADWREYVKWFHDSRRGGLVLGYPEWLQYQQRQKILEREGDKEVKLFIGILLFFVTVPITVLQIGFNWLFQTDHRTIGDILYDNFIRP